MRDMIKRAFRESEMSMKRLAERSDTHYASVHGFFAGESGANLESIERWCRVLGLELRAKRERKQVQHESL